MPLSRPYKPEHCRQEEGVGGEGGEGAVAGEEREFEMTEELPSVCLLHFK